MTDNNRGEDREIPGAETHIDPLMIKEKLCMKKVTDELLKTHQLVRKVLEGFDPANERFQPVLETLHRTVLAHAHLQDQILIPALENKTLIQKPLLSELFQEHKDLDHMLKALLAIPQNGKDELQAGALQIRTVLETHFKKEAVALYPLVEKVMDPQTLNRLAEEMERRQTEVRDLAHATR
jgi:hemerythrin-like domain-containing protein